MHRCINLTAGAVGRFENPEGMGWMRTFGGDCFSPMVGDTILPYLVYLNTCMTENFGTVRNKILVKKKDPPVCPEFWYGREQNSGEKERPSCMS